MLRVETLSQGQQWLGLLRATRMNHWIKNAVCFAGVVFSGSLVRPESVLLAMLACAGFCFAASGIYLINDIFDRNADRMNPCKRDRPIAAGIVPASWAIRAAAVLFAAALLTTVVLPPICFAIILAYIVICVGYSWKLKHLVIVDVMIIAAGFVLRVLHGVYAVGVIPSAWILLCMFFLALFLGFAKRRGELLAAGEFGWDRRPVLEAYRAPTLDRLLMVSAVMAIVCYALYAALGRPDKPELAWTVPLVALGVIRYGYLVLHAGVGRAPEKDLIADRGILLITGCWCLACIGILYRDSFPWMIP